MARIFPWSLVAVLSLFLLGLVPNASAADRDAGSGPTSSYLVSCSPQVQKEVPIVRGPCAREQKAFADAFGCNRVNEFYSACRAFFGCLANNSSGRYAQAYRSKVSQCNQYR